MKDIERDLDFILLKTNQLATVINQQDYDLLESKELIRQQLIKQFFVDYSAEDIVAVSDKFQQLVTLSTDITEQCEQIFEQSKQDILKIKQSAKIKKAYK
ncbi:hypothetical protein NBRC116592_05220 [Colwellia sp. KU-HH00111]|uniref:hypothetical protein n=1 Tax=Colwellia sp. KU-HH00111 TaxID=3127652 RepID=UPI0031099142